MKETEKIVKESEKVLENGTSEKHWWEVFTDEFAGDKEIAKLIELINKAEHSKTHKDLEKAIDAVESSKILRKKGYEEAQNKLNRKIKVVKNATVRSISDNFGALIKYTRTSKGYSLQKLGQLTDLSASYIQRMETGERKAPGVKVVESLAGALEIDMRELLQVAGLSESEEKGPAVSIGTLILSSDVYYKEGSVDTEAPKTLSKQEKTLLVSLIDLIVGFQWDEKTKHLDTVELITLVDKFKKSQLIVE